MKDLNPCKPVSKSRPIFHDSFRGKFNVNLTWWIGRMNSINLFVASIWLLLIHICLSFHPIDRIKWQKKNCKTFHQTDLNLIFSLSLNPVNIYLYEMKKKNAVCPSESFPISNGESLWINQANDWVNIQSITTVTRSIC